MLTDACEIHFLNMVRFRQLMGKPEAAFSLENPLHRWLVYFDEHSSQEMVEEVIKMDTAIQMAQEKMDMIARDPDMLRAYEQYEKAASDYTSGINGARREGRQEGREEGREEKALEDAKNFLELGLSPEQVAQGTGLPLDVISKL
jgi:predicted transposase/invertase (TIGR01784 family)